MLIGAVWLLVLCASIAGLMMLRSVAAAKSEAQGEKALRDQLLRGAAVETAKADRLFNGQRSRWWALPAREAVNVDGQDVEITLDKADMHDQPAR